MKKHLKPLERIRIILTSNIFVLIYLIVFFIIFIYPSFNNYFLGDDFSWLRWASESNTKTLLLNFIDAQGFFFRPIPKLLFFIEFNFFHLNPLPYYIINLFFNFLTSVAAYFLFLIIFKKKSLAFLGAFIFSFIPSHSQNLYWISAISPTVSSLFILSGLIFYYLTRVKSNLIYFSFSFILFMLAVFTYENSVIFIGLMFLVDLFLIDRNNFNKISTKIYPYIISVFIIVIYLLLRHNANAAGFSGDYNYNLAKAIPNSVGNYIGYIFMFFAGEKSLPFYISTRESLRTYYVLLTVIGAFVMAFIGGFLIEHREKIRIGSSAKLFIFGFLFSVVSLLPYLPLGNISLRYLYLGSFGFIVMFIAALNGLVIRTIKKKQCNNCFYVALVAIIGFSCYLGLQSSENHWNQASQISLSTFSKLKSGYNFNNDTHLYFYNVPIKIGEAYVFPVGLADAVYFASNNPTLKVFIIGDRTIAARLSKGAMGNGFDTFTFGYNKNILKEEK